MWLHGNLGGVWRHVFCLQFIWHGHVLPYGSSFSGLSCCVRYRVITPGIVLTTLLVCSCIEVQIGFLNLVEAVQAVAIDRIRVMACNTEQYVTFVQK